MSGMPEGSITKVMEIVRARTKRVALPDRCTITKPSGTPTISATGTLTWSGGTTLVEYEGSTSIPCRFEISRSFRPETTEFQEIVASEFAMYFPVDVQIQTGYVIKLTDPYNVVRWFEPRKISNVSDWDVVTEVTVEEIMPQQEPTS